MGSWQWSASVGIACPSFFFSQSSFIVVPEARLFEKAAQRNFRAILSNFHCDRDPFLHTFIHRRKSPHIYHRHLSADPTGYLLFLQVSIVPSPFLRRPFTRNEIAEVCISCELLGNPSALRAAFFIQTSK